MRFIVEALADDDGTWHPIDNGECPDKQGAIHLLQKYEELYTRLRVTTSIKIRGNTFSCVRDAAEHLAKTIVGEMSYVEQGDNIDHWVHSFITCWENNGLALDEPLYHDDDGDEVEGLEDAVRAAVERLVRYAVAPTVRLDNLAGESGIVMVDVSGLGVKAWAKEDQSISGSLWEIADDDLEYAYAYAIVDDHPGLVDELEKEGYKLNLDDYSPPSEPSS